MAEIELNKPLYGSDGKGGDSSFTPPKPRPPASSLLSRGAALFVDILLLHLVFRSICQMAPAIPLTLGPVAPWLGLAIGYVYFGLGFSHVTLGRTLGKLIMRVQVCDITGPDLSVGRGFLRAIILFWPFALVQILRTVSEHSITSDPESYLARVEPLGMAMTIGWIVGNWLYATGDPTGRTLYDRKLGTVVINAELEPGPVAQHLAEVRHRDAEPTTVKSTLGFGLAFIICTAFGIAMVLQTAQLLRQAPQGERETMAGVLLDDGHYAHPYFAGAEAKSTETIHLTYQVRSYRPYDREALKNDVATTAALDRVAQHIVPFVQAKVVEQAGTLAQERAENQQAPLDPPTTLSVSLSYTEYADMFFGRFPHEVYRLRHDVTIPTSATLTTNDDAATTSPAGN